jgi:hypothetical protein
MGFKVDPRKSNTATLLDAATFGMAGAKDIWKTTKPPNPLIALRKSQSAKDVEEGEDQSSNKPTTFLGSLPDSSSNKYTAYQVSQGFGA